MVTEIKAIVIMTNQINDYLRLMQHQEANSVVKQHAHSSICAILQFAKATELISKDVYNDFIESANSAFINSCK